MRLGSVIPHRSVSSAWDASPFAITITGRRWGLGFVIHEWGVRFLLTKWQACVHWR